MFSPGYWISLFMGNYLSNQFLRALRAGDTVKASQLYQTKAKLRENIQPNLNLGSEHNDNTFLHYAALYGMREMYEDLLRQNGKPDMKNSQRRNCLHLICLGSDLRLSDTQDAIKCQMLELTVKEGLEGMDLKHLLAEKDENGNTALHLAAGAGLKECVDLLLTYEADMVATNDEGLTPADLAKAKQHGQIATSLEAKMVFSDLAEPVETDSVTTEEPVATRMHDRDLRSMKDALLIETSEMLGVTLLSAEMLLKHYGWSKEELLQAWLESAQAVCEQVGVERPVDGNSDFLGTSPQEVGVAGNGAECGICYSACDHAIQIACGHQFCKTCWKEYLEEKIGRGESQHISCPEFGCYKPVPPEVIEGVVSQDMAVKFLSFDIKAFVDSNPNIRWCPHPGCSQAVGRPTLPDSENLSPSHSSAEVNGQTVPCGSGHYFCWDCLGEAHEPCSCSRWAKWLDHCNEMKGKIGETTAAEANEAASSKWLVDYSKPCPKCKAPIEKTEGCNHMCCKYCRHDFCWVCLEDWKCHNSSTGGYFNCNRYVAQLKAAQTLDHRRQVVLKDCKDWEEMSKFLHYYERYKEHIKSYELEEPFLDKAQEKMIELAESIRYLESSEGSGQCSVAGTRHLDLSFIQEAVEELLKCRRVLKATYSYGYYLTGIISKKQFEHMQGALEQVTEMLAEAVARPHLRKPRLEIIRLTREAREKRVGLVKNVQSGLPLSSHPFIDSVPWDNAGSGRSRHSSLSRFLRDLDTYTPRNRGHASLRSNAHRPDTDEDFLRVLEMSRQEFEADQQVTADVELAKTLSLRNTGPQSPLTTPTQATPTCLVGNSWLDQLSIPDDCLDEPAWPVLQLQPHPAPPTNSPSHNWSPTTDQHLNGDTRLQSSFPTADFGPVYDEDEDLRRAIQDSLQDSENLSSSASAGHVTSSGTKDLGHVTSSGTKDLGHVTSSGTTDLGHVTSSASADLGHVTSSASALTENLGHVTSSAGTDGHMPRGANCGKGHHNGAATRKRDVLVTGRHLSKPKTTSRHQYVGHNSRTGHSGHTDSTPSAINHLSVNKDHSKNKTTRELISMVEFSGPLFAPCDSKDGESLPSSLRQLLDSDDRLGTNV